MYLIQALMSGQIPFIPTTLPPGLHEMASDQTLPGSTVASHATGNSGSFHHGMPGSFPQTSGSGIVQPQVTGKQLQPQYSGRPLQQQFTGPVAHNQTGSSARKAPASAPFSTFTPQSQLAWDVTPTEKASADKHFDSLDTQKGGYIESDVAVPFMLQSKLPGTDLASIWLAISIYSSPLTSHTIHRDLADLNNDGRLTRDGFAVAFHLIQGKLSGKEIPTTLPTSLMPPSMRPVTVPTTSPFQQPPSDSLNDLLWEDSPVTSQPPSATLQPQRTGHTQSPAISASHTQGQITFGMSRFFFKGRMVYGLL
jgi:epidermal growth factor receptor substrate 15